MPVATRTGYAFDSIVVLTNPVSKHASVANNRIGSLTKKYPGLVQVVETHKDPRASQRAILKKLAALCSNNKKPVLAVAGGDGTVNFVIQTIVDAATPPQVRDVPIVPLGTGNANDLAWMLYSNPADITHIFARGEPIHVRPLQCTVRPPKGPAAHFMAANYISFGATAHGAHELNKPEVREHPHRKAWYGDFVPDILAIRAALQAPPFHMQANGHKQRIHELLVGNGGRIAKFGKMPVKLGTSEMYVTLVEENWLGKSALTISALKLALGILPGTVMQGTPYTFEVLDDVAAQFDGEPTYIAAGSSVTVQPSDRAFRALTTKVPS